MQVRFFDAHVRPPRGGWTFPIQGELVAGYSEAEIIEKVAAVQRNNGTFVSNEAIIAALWERYCANEPERCGGRAVPAPVDGRPAPANIVPREVTSALQGPPIWLFLNTLSVQWTPGLHPYFLDTCDAITVILECPTCREEWRDILRSDSPRALSSKFGVCQWVNRAHNRVNGRAGKQEFPYWKMVTEFGAPLT